jgi:hypothetical protein
LVIANKFELVGYSEMRLGQFNLAAVIFPGVWSAAVPGRSNVAKQAGGELSKARCRLTWLRPGADVLR